MRIVAGQRAGDWPLVPCRVLALPPRAPGLDVEGRIFRTFRDVGAHVHAEPSGNEITKSDAPCLGRVGVAEVRAGAPGPSRAEEADQSPARTSADRKSTRLNSSHGHISY